MSGRRRKREELDSVQGRLGSVSEVAQAERAAQYETRQQGQHLFEQQQQEQQQQLQGEPQLQSRNQPARQQGHHHQEQQLQEQRQPSQQQKFPPPQLQQPQSQPQQPQSQPQSQEAQQKQQQEAQSQSKAREKDDDQYEDEYILLHFNSLVEGEEGNVQLQNMLQSAREVEIEYNEGRVKVTIDEELSFEGVTESVVGSWAVFAEDLNGGEDAANQRQKTSIEGDGDSSMHGAPKVVDRDREETGTHEPNAYATTSVPPGAKAGIIRSSSSSFLSSPPPLPTATTKFPTNTSATTSPAHAATASAKKTAPETAEPRSTERHLEHKQVVEGINLTSGGLGAPRRLSRNNDSTPNPEFHYLCRPTKEIQLLPIL